MILIDTREPQEGSWERYFRSPSARQKLDTGDFSLAGCEHLVAIERKSLDDLISCLTYHRHRFEKELFRARALERFFVIVEADYNDLLSGNYRSAMEPEAAVQSIAAMSIRHNTAFLFAGKPASAAHLAESLLKKWYADKARIIKNAQSYQLNTKDN